ncbi:MAG TPA: hypothetical protein VGK03_00535 [Geothrix sp.]|jgi:transcriptional regulator with XRE-family HTH domain
MTTARALHLFIKELHTPDLQSDEDFHRLFNVGVDLLALPDKDLAHEFGASRPTISRWRNALNTPHPAMRKHIYAWMEKRARTVLRRIEKSKELPERAEKPKVRPVIGHALAAG